MPHSLQATSLEAPFFRLLPGELFGFNSQGTVDIPESEVYSVVVAVVHIPLRAALVKGKATTLHFFPLLLCLIKSFFFFLTINSKFFLKDVHFVPTAANEAKGKESSAGTRVSLVTHTALALSAESDWICLFSAPSMLVHRCTQGDVESHQRIFLYKAKKMCCLSGATRR